MNHSANEMTSKNLELKLSELQLELQRIKYAKKERLPKLFQKTMGWIASRTSHSSAIDLRPVHDIIKTESGAYYSTGIDPQLIVVPQRPAVVKKMKQARIEFDLECTQATDVEFFLDVGSGFESDLVLKLHHKNNGKIIMDTYLPRSLRSIRIDPMSAPGEFVIRDAKISEISEINENNNQNLNVLKYLRNLSNGTPELKPQNQITRNLAEEFEWTSQGDDPQIYLNFPSKSKPFTGWKKIIINIKFKNIKYSNTKFYFDIGNGFVENESLSFQLKSGGRQEKLFFFDKSLLKIRLDPLEEEDNFTIQELSFEDAGSEDQIRACILQQISAKRNIKKDEVLYLVKKDSLDKQPSLQSLFDLYRREILEASHHDIGYEDWIENNERPTLPSPAEAVQQINKFLHKPLFSLVIPVYNTDEKFLRECIESVLHQSYSHWELCIADDASPKPYIRDVLQDYQTQNNNIHVVFRQINGHISQASNSALSLATGDFVVLLDHDDVLPEHALFFMAEAINRNPSAQILYSDEDKIDASGQRFAPHFKSDWNPDLFFSQNYVSHLGVYRRALLQRIGGFRTGFEGSQDQDLLLRCLPYVQAEDIVHIPRVLYHWRALEGSTALASGEKSYTTNAGIKALRDYFSKHGPRSVKVEAGLLPNTYHVLWPIPQPAPLVSLLIPTRDKKEITEAAVQSILKKTTYKNYEIIILDNGSIEPQTLTWFDAIQKEEARVKVLRYDYPFNFSAINNFGVKHSQGELIGLINNDIEVISHDWLTEMVRHACRPEIGCVGAKLYYSNDTLQHAGVILGIGGVAGHSHKYFSKNSNGYFSRLMLVQNTSAVTAACLLVRREIYEKVDGLDENNLKIAFNDVDFCLKVRNAGWLNLFTPYAELYHHESISRGQENTQEKIERFNNEVYFMKNKWKSTLEHDPFYSQNLTKNREDFSIR
jgi:GT2 family glycosyltransferase